MKNEDRIVELLAESLQRQDQLIERLDRHIEETHQQTGEIRLQTSEIRKLAEAANRKADAAWELVVMTKNEFNRPWWRRLFGG